MNHYFPLKAKVGYLDEGFDETHGDIVMATSWETVWPALATGKFAKKFYFVQDFEPAFFPMGSTATLAAEDTYRQDLSTADQRVTLAGAKIGGRLWPMDVLFLVGCPIEKSIVATLRPEKKGFP